MATPRKLPRPFEMHWGNGQIVEEASFNGEHHEPTLQLMQFTDGPVAGTYSLRFCSYGPRGSFSRSPLMLSAADIEGLRRSLEDTPQLRALLKRLVD